MPVALTIAEALPGCEVFEHKDGKPYCFYAQDSKGALYRVLWTDFTGLKEKDLVIVDHNDIIKTLRYENGYPSGWTPNYEITAIEVHSGNAACISKEGEDYLLTLPQSGQTIIVKERWEQYLPYITDDLVAQAEAKIVQAVAEYSNHSGFYLQVTDDDLCLVVEVIHKFDNPSAGSGSEDHEHLFFSERITALPFPACN